MFERLRIGTENEVNFCNVIGNVFGKKHCDFTYVCGEDKESRDILNNGTGNKIFDTDFPLVIYKTTLQKQGADFLYNNLITLDLKVTGKNQHTGNYYDRACFELYMIDGEYKYKQPRDSHVIVTVMRGKEIYSFPTGLIEDIVNKKGMFPLPKDFYINNDSFQMIKGGIKKGEQVYRFCINPNILQECLSDYIPLYCDNRMTRKLFYKAEKYIDNEHTYIEESNNTIN